MVVLLVKGFGELVIKVVPEGFGGGGVTLQVFPLIKGRSCNWPLILGGNNA